MKKSNNIEKISKEASEFKNFISRGNVVDMAVGVIIGGAFGKIVTSLVNDLLMPLIGVIIGGFDFSNLSFKVGDAVIAYGNFIQTIVDFLIISICIFLMIRFFERFKKKESIVAEEKTSKKSDEVLLLEEIRDLLKKKK
ncbi:MAG: large-conductance mechanosensitive channel protein MscL [bacterium]|nr:large-conductance mechanosensitive channel protein MscL [bacterium]